MSRARRQRLRLGIVSMMKDGSVSDAVLCCFAELGVAYVLYKYNTPDLISLIADGPETHWFFTGNTPDFVTDEGAPGFDMRILDISNKNMFFVCYSHQYVCKQLGSCVWPCWKPIRGIYPIVRVRGEDPIFCEVSPKQWFFAYYGQYVRTEDVPAGWELLARQGNHVVLMRLRDSQKAIYSCQVHPERLVDTYRMLYNWLKM